LLTNISNKSFPLISAFLLFNRHSYLLKYLEISQRNQSTKNMKPKGSHMYVLLGKVKKNTTGELVSLTNLALLKLKHFPDTRGRREEEQGV